MEQFFQQTIDRRLDGTMIVRNHFVNPTGVNHLVNAQGHFTKAEKLIAKNKHKAYLKSK